MWLLAVGAGIGALVAFFLDPQAGRRRRAMTRDRTLGTVRRARRTSTRAGRMVAADAYGLKQKATHLREEPKEPPNDAWIKQKVESELFRPADVPKGQIVVNAENGVVILRGEVPRPELIDDFVRRTRKIRGVRDVENLLHLPQSEPQMHQAHRRW